MGRGDAAGGSLLLGELIDEHGEALYRDLHFYHQIDLREVVRKWKRNKGGGTSPRFLLYLIEQLPEDSTFMAERAGGREHRPWTTVAYLLAAAANNVQVNTMITGNVPKKSRKDFHLIEGPRPPKAKRSKGPSFGDMLAAMAGTSQIPDHLIKK